VNKKNAKMRKCACCGYYAVPGYFDICRVCEWQQDDVQENDPDFEGGANEMSLNQYKAWWQKEHHREGLVTDGGGERT
jgi:hypothetical protein